MLNLKENAHVINLTFHTPVVNVSSEVDILTIRSPRGMGSTHYCLPKIFCCSQIHASKRHLELSIAGSELN